MEQLNIQGKRSGDGFICHKDKLTNALIRATADRVTLFNEKAEIGKRGFIGYLKAIPYSVVKVIPHDTKSVKVIAGSHSGIVPQNSWITDKTPHTLVSVKVMPVVNMMSNIGSGEITELLSKLLLFCSTDEHRASLNCVKFEIANNVLTMTASDSFTACQGSIYFEHDDCQALIDRMYIKSLIPAIRKAKRLKLSFAELPAFENNRDITAKHIVFETELIRYQMPTADYSYPDLSKVMPNDDALPNRASFDTREAIKAIRSLLALWYDDKIKASRRHVIMSITDDKLVLSAKADRASIEVPTTDISGNATVAFDGSYLLRALQACSGIVEVKTTGEISKPVVFTVDGMTCLVMPVSVEADKAKAEAKVTKTADVVKQAEAVVSEAGKGKSKKHNKALAKVKA